MTAVLASTMIISTLLWLRVYYKQQARINELLDEIKLYNMENNKSNKLIINRKGKRLTIMCGEDIITFDKDKLQPYINSYSRDVFIKDLIEQIKLLNKYKLSDEELYQIFKELIPFLDIKTLITPAELKK